MSSKVGLQSATSGRNAFSADMDITFRFLVVSNNEKSIIDQTLTIERVEGGYRSSLTLDDMPFKDTPQASVDKLTDWLDRLSEALKAHDFEGMNLNKL